MSKTLHQEKVDINAELRVCANFLQEVSMKLPSHLKETDLQVLSTRERVALMEKRLKEIAAIEAKASEVEAKKKELSLKKLMKLKDDLYYLRESINKDVSTLHHEHKSVFFELEKSLAQMLRTHKPTPKQTKKKEVA